MQVLQEDNIWLLSSDESLIESFKIILSTTNPNIKDQNGYTPLHGSVSYNNIEAVKLLIEKGADVNITDLEGDTPLHYCETEDIAILLITSGANPSQLNNMGYLPIETAHMEGHSGLVEYLKAFTPEFRMDRNEEIEDSKHIEFDTEEFHSVEIIELARLNGVKLDIVTEEDTDYLER